MFNLKDKIGNDILVASHVMMPQLKRGGVVTGTTTEGAVEVRLRPSKTSSGKESGVEDVIVDPEDVMVCQSSYTITIDEDQRLALLDLITKAGADKRDSPLEFWKSMLTDLPKDEMETPGVIHGFCL